MAEPPPSLTPKCRNIGLALDYATQSRARVEVVIALFLRALQCTRKVLGGASFSQGGRMNPAPLRVPAESKREYAPQSMYVKR